MVSRYGLSELYAPPNDGIVTAQYVHSKANMNQLMPPLTTLQYHLRAWPLRSPSEDMGGEEETFEIPTTIE